MYFDRYSMMILWENHMKKKKLSKQIPNIIFALIFLVGLCIFLYPSVSNYINSLHQSSAIKDYEEMLSDISEEDYEAFWEAAVAYNERIASGMVNYNLSDEEYAEYESLLNPTGTGMMGYLEIENIGVKLPVYHGDEESVLAIGIGHIPGTSLPTGTDSTHAVLSGHRGLPSSKLLTDLDQMIEGDTFLLHIMDKTFAYEVDQINIVLPNETEGLGVYDGKDYVTLVTCTPYGVNTHRLLVRGHRVDYNAETRLIIPADATKISNITVALYIAGFILAVTFIVFLIMTSKRFRNR